MRKFLSLTLCLLAYAFCAVAQQTHWSYQYGQHKSEAYIFADIEMYQETAGGSFEQLEFTASDYQSYQFAAFLDGELRGLAEVMSVQDAQKETYVLRFRVEGDENEGSEITFKAYDPALQKEYDLALASEPIFFSGDQTIGEPSIPLHLQLTLPVETTPVNSITTPFVGFNTDTGAFAYIECNVGDDLTPYFVDGMAFHVSPAEATNKAVTFELYEGNQSLVMDKANNITVATTGAGMVKVISVDNPQISCVVYVIAFNDFSTLSAAQDVLNVTYKDQPVNITEQVEPLFVLGPEGCQTFGGDYSIVSSAPDIVEINDNGAFANAPGEAVLTATMSVVNRLQKTFDPNGNHTTTVSASVRIVVTQGVTGLQVVWPTTLATEQMSDVTVKPLPQGAKFNANATFTISGSYVNYDATVDNTGCYYDSGSNEGIGWVFGEIPGDLTLTVTYNDGEGTEITESSEIIECGYTFGMNEGWEWRSIPYADFSTLNSLQTVFGTELVEIRTQSGQLYNDPVYGYFGDTDLLDQNVGFKLKMGELTAPPSQEVINYLKSYVFYGGSLGMSDNLTLRKGWNYLPNPYVMEQTFDDALSLNKTFVDGDRIVSKEDGFAEYANGQWTGNLTAFRPGQGYLFFNAGDASRTINFAQEIDPAHSRRASARSMASSQESSPSIWQYDASRFRDNMTIIASIDNRPAAGHYSIGAFVGDECRGEGVAVDGRLFITVHANNGEVVSFKLYDETTGQVYDIDQQLPMQQMLGTVKQPYSMTANDVVTSIDDLPTASLRQQGRSYDLLGRPTTDRQMVKGQLRIVDGKKMLK